MMRRPDVLILFLLLMSLSFLEAQERLYWDFPESVAVAYGGRFPQLLAVDGGFALIWQEFSGERGSLDATVMVKAAFSADAADWDGEPLTVARGIPYLWLEEVPLFSAAVSGDGRVTVAVAEARSGLGIYGQTSSGFESPFRNLARVPQSADAADTSVAPRLAAMPDGGFLLFLTRRTAVEGASRPTTLTIFTVESPDGLNWGTARPFLDPALDRSPNGEVLEQNFLPAYHASGGREYAAFQSLRQGPEYQVYQIYLKSRTAGGNWEPAAAVSEALQPVPAVTDVLEWDNQRPFIGRGAGGELLLLWERRRSLSRPNVVVLPLEASGRPAADVVETVSDDGYISSFPQLMQTGGRTWVVWFDDTGIRLAERRSAFNFAVQAASLDAQSTGADRGSALFPSVVRQGEDSFLVWQDRSAGVPRAIVLRPDLSVDTPRLLRSNFLTGRPGNIRSLTVDWRVPDDSSGILSYNWLWSRNPDARPERMGRDEGLRSARILHRLDETEGPWYFSLIVKDQAGNWSDPLRLTYILDTTPPPPPLVAAPPTDAYGVLESNSFTIDWDDAEREAASYYRWRLDYLGASVERVDLDVLDALRIDSPRRAYDSSGGESGEKTRFWGNVDNGVWAFSVAAVDEAGNAGLPSTRVLIAGRYVPVTFISNISASRDEADRIVLRITGRGFAVGGNVTEVMIDADGESPWDYSFNNGDGRMRVLSDRVVEVCGIEEMEQGTYRVGVTHPVRGTVFWSRTLRLDATGNVKFGSFGIYAYESIWEPVASRLHISGKTLLVVLAVLISVVSLILAAIRMASVISEARTFGADARALLERMPLSLEAGEEEFALLRRKGMGLRRKFILSLGVLVIITITMIAAVLGAVWLRMERDSLAEGLWNESRLLVDTLTSSAQNSIPAADRGALLLLPERISALDDALWTTVTGPRGRLVNGVLESTGEGAEYVWASNDPDILDKLEFPARLDSDARRLALEAADEDQAVLLEAAYPPSGDGTASLTEVAPEDRSVLAELFRQTGILPFDPALGRYVVDDDLSADIEEMRQVVEQTAQDAGISDMITELGALERQYTEYARQVALTLDFDNPAYAEAEAAVAAQKKEIETLLLEISNSRFSSVPEFSSEKLKPGGPDAIVFYRPLLYRVGGQDANFFRGTVRLAVSVEDVRFLLATVQRRILVITLVASAAALGLGILAAMFISSLMLRPIRALYRGVSTIREQPDMLQHEDFDVSLRTRDELAELADTINGMVRGLVQAAIEQKELVAGQEIQKTFLPLERDEKTGKKLSTGGAGNAFFRLFGYYEGADAVSGDYFDFRQLDDDHYVMIKLDVAGHGVTASLIMVQVAALYVDYFRRVRDRAAETGRLTYKLREFTFGINDLINEVGFKGRFAAFNLSVVNVRTNRYKMIHAGDNLVHVFDGKTRKMKLIELPESPATGQIDSFMIEMNPAMYKEVDGSLERGDVLFLYTDGIEEAHHILRDENYEIITYENLSQSVRDADSEFVEAGYKAMDETQDNEEFDPVRIDEVIEAAMNCGSYVLKRRCDLTIGKPLHFDFTTLSGSGEDAVMALASVEKVFRIIPDQSGDRSSRVRVDRKIVEFLKKNFREFDEFYSHPVDDDGESPYVFFSHMREDPQDDDLTIWAYECL